MQELESHGALDNTIVMLFSDHGRAMLRDKRFKYIVNHIPGQPYLAFNAYKNLRYDEYLDWWDKELKRMGK